MKNGFLICFSKSFLACSRTCRPRFFLSILLYDKIRNVNKQTLFSIEQSANFHSLLSFMLQIKASIHSLLPELGTPVTTVNSPGTTCSRETTLKVQQKRHFDYYLNKIAHQMSLSLSSLSFSISLTIQKYRKLKVQNHQDLNRWQNSLEIVSEVGI